MTKLANFFFILLLSATLPAAAQGVRYTISPKNAEVVLKAERLAASVEYLSDPSLGGRAFGTEGGRRTAAWIEEAFRELKLEPLAGAWMHGFTSGGSFGRNVLGLIPGTSQPERYIVVMAHFDNLGTLGGTFYPGADSNASGVAALVELARMFRHMQDCRKNYGSGILFVALDGKEKDLAGASQLWRLLEQGKLGISPEQISLVVNLDQLGATLAPLTNGNPHYLMMLSDPATGRRSTLESVNKTQAIGLELGYDYYGSKDFTQLFFRRISDQRVFLEHGVPAVMFTSGITLNNNKAADTAETLNYPVFRKRVQLIFYYLDRLR